MDRHGRHLALRGLLLIVLIANLVGCLLFAFAVAKLGLVSAGVEREMIEIVAHLMENSQFQMFAKGIGAGWIIAALVWMLPSSEGTEIFIITLITYIIALGDFTHSGALGVGDSYVGTGLLQQERDQPLVVRDVFRQEDATPERHRR